MKLTNAQQTALDKMEQSKWYSAYDLQCSIATMGVLQRKVLVEAHPENHGPGAMFCPRNAKQWRRTEKPYTCSDCGKEFTGVAQPYIVHDAYCREWPDCLPEVQE